MSTGVFPGGKCGRCVRLTTYHHPVPLSRNLGTLTSWNRLGLFLQRVVESTHLPSRLNMVNCWANLTSAYFWLRVPRVCVVQISTRTRRRNSRLRCPATEFSGSQLVWRPRNSEFSCRTRQGIFLYSKDRLWRRRGGGGALLGTFSIHDVNFSGLHQLLSSKN